MKKTLLLLVAVVFALQGFAQSSQTAYGSTERAKKSSHHTDKELRNPVVRLGYIDMDEATLQEFMDNLEVGLVMAGAPNNRVVSYYVTIVPKGTDIRGEVKVMGGKMPRKIFDELHMGDLKPGDKVLFEDIKAEFNEHSVRTMNSVTIKITS